MKFTRLMQWFIGGYATVNTGGPRVPSFRDLKGREVEDVVDSRIPSMAPSTAVAPVEAAEIRAATEKVLASRPGRRPAVEMVDADDPLPRASTPLPGDIEQGLLTLEGTLARIEDLHDQMATLLLEARAQMAAVRDRAQADADKLAKVDAALRMLK